jgi:hypothetical protein
VTGADCGYAAALFDYFGTIESRPAREGGGAWYLGVAVGDSRRFLPVMKLIAEFGGRQLAPNRWLVIGDLAASFLTCVRPHSQYARERIDRALSEYTRACVPVSSQRALRSETSRFPVAPGG